MLLAYRILVAAGLCAVGFSRAVSGRLPPDTMKWFSSRLARGPLQLKRPPSPTSVLVHAVSVGEVRAMRPLVKSLRSRDPDGTLVLTTTTPTGQKLALDECREASLITYFPFDLSGPVRRFLRQTAPRISILAETELWPVWLDHCRQRDIPVALVNGRISDRSYGRYRLVRRFLKPHLNALKVVCAQSTEDAARLEDLGISARRIEVTGNLKYDLPAREQGVSPEEVRKELGLEDHRPILVAGSTCVDEEKEVLRAFASLRRRHSNLLLMIAPRRTERFIEVAEMVRHEGYRLSLRSTGYVTGSDALVLDTLGELARAYGAATVAFVGGSLVPVGGHNILEPASWGCPVLYGPHTHNFREMTELFDSRKAGLRVRDAQDLAEKISTLLDDPGKRAAVGEAGLQIVQESQGATARTIKVLEPFLPVPLSGDREAPAGIE